MSQGNTIETNEQGQVFSVSPTGGRKEIKLERFDLIPVEPLRKLARVYGKGAAKYADRNWERGYDWSNTYASLQRHLNAFWDGEDIDPELGTEHLANAAWHCFVLLEFMQTHPEYDNRPSTVKRILEKQAEEETLRSKFEKDWQEGAFRILQDVRPTWGTRRQRLWKWVTSHF